MTSDNLDSLGARITSCLAALLDLRADYSWRELHVDVKKLLNDARQLGVDLSDLEIPVDLR
jgi:hypothetical protein